MVHQLDAIGLCILRPVANSETGAALNQPSVPGACRPTRTKKPNGNRPGAIVRLIGGGPLTPAFIKTLGYLVSTASVALLGVAAFPGAQKAGLTAVLFAGMAASVAGMALRWWSYEIENRRKAARHAAAVTTELRSPGARDAAAT